MMGSEARLCGGMELEVVFRIGKALVHRGHKEFCEWWGDSYRSVIFRCVLIAFAFVDG
jgi:hypothetical protein